MSERKCGLCGRDPAVGYASVTVGDEETHFCHGDFDDEPTCYERQGQDDATQRLLRAIFGIDGPIEIHQGGPLP